MAHIGLLVTPDPTVPARPIEFDPTQLVTLLHEILDLNGDTIDSTSVLHTPYGPLVMWVGDSSLSNEKLAHNDRAIGICRAARYNVADVRGNVFFVGGVDADRYHEGLDPALLAELQRALDTFPTDLPMEYGPAPKQDDVVQILQADNVDELLAALYPEGRPSDG